MRRSFLVRNETVRNGSEIIFASKRNRGVPFACFALKQNSGFHMRNEKEVKQNKEKKAKRNEIKEVKQKKQSEK